MPDGPRKASLRAPTTMERIRSGLQDTLGIPERVWGMPLPDETIEKHRAMRDAIADKGPVMRAPTTLERIQESLRPVTSVLEAIGSPLENAEMGPSQAITLATRKPILELMKRLHPRNAAGMMADPDEFPNIVEAVNTAIESHPRVMSHLNSVNLSLDPQGSVAGQFYVPNHITKYMRNMGPDLWKGSDAGPVARMDLNPVIEGRPGEAADTVYHETGHLAQWLADPTRMLATGNQAQRMLSKIPSVAARPGMAYHLNPAEISARAIGARGKQRVAGEALTPYNDALRTSIGGNADPAAFRDVWSQARTALMEEMMRSGERMRPIQLPPTKPPVPAGPLTQPTLFSR